MDMSSTRKYFSERQPGPNPRDGPYRQNRKSARNGPGPVPEPSIRSLTRNSDDGLLPPPLPQIHHNRSSDSMSSTTSSTASRRLCAKCGQPMADKFVRAMGKKFHLDCFRCYVRSPLSLCVPD
jgi:LIM domain